MTVKRFVLFYLAPCRRFKPKPFFNGYIVSDGFRHSEQVTFGCQSQSFVIDGQATLHCFNGKWDNEKPSCAGTANCAICVAFLKSLKVYIIC